MQQKKQLYWLIVIATIARCSIALTTELGNDEVYYLTYARHLQWNYFDHPPMVALLIRITTFNLNFTNDFFVRLGPTILAVVNTWLVYSTTKKLKNETAAFIAALLFTASPFCSIIAGTFILPDAPQLFFYILSLKLLLEIINSDTAALKRNHLLLLFGISSGLCIMSKVHGAFLWLGLGAFIVFNKQVLLRNSNLYIAALLTAFIISPILIWNIQNNFVTWNFHSNRVVANSGLHADSFIRELLGGIAYNNPVNYFLIIYVIIVFFRNNKWNEQQSSQLLLWQSVPLIIILLAVSLFRDTLPHWSGPAYTSLIIFAAVHLSDNVLKQNFITLHLRKIAFSSCILIFIIAMAGIAFVNYYPGTAGKKETTVLGDGDVTVDMYGWKQAADKFNKLYTANKLNKVTTTDFIAAGKWFPAAHIDNYIASPLKLNFTALGDTNDIHTYAWLNNFRKQLQPGNDAYFITMSNNYQNPNEKYSGIFKSVTALDSIPVVRNGLPAKYMFVFLMRGYQKK